MRKAIEWLEEVRKKKKIIGQTELAKLLDVSRSSITHNQNNRFSFSVKTEVKIANVLEIDPMLVTASTMHEQSQTEKDKKFWEQVYNAHEANPPTRKMIEKWAVFKGNQ